MAFPCWNNFITIFANISRPSHITLISKIRIIPKTRIFCTTPSTCTSLLCISRCIRTHRHTQSKHTYNHTAYNSF